MGDVPGARRAGVLPRGRVAQDPVPAVHRVLAADCIGDGIDNAPREHGAGRGELSVLAHPRSTSLAWGAYELELADHQFERQRLHTEGYTLKPSELFKRQCHLVGWFDRTGLKTREHIGVANMLWSTNFPQATSTWPESQHAIARCFEGIPDNEKRQVLVGNPAKLYKIDA
jgi:hypothetical protein